MRIANKHLKQRGLRPLDSQQVARRLGERYAFRDMNTVKFKNVVFMFFLLVLSSCQLHTYTKLPLTDKQNELIKLGYKHDSWPIKITKDLEKSPDNSQLFAILFFEKYFGSNKLDIIEKPLNEVNKTSLDIVFIEDENNFIRINIAYYEYGQEKNKVFFNSEIKAESFFQFDAFYIKKENGYSFQLFLNQKNIAALDTNIQYINQVYNMYTGSVGVMRYY
jgi:hypothetical protein